MRLNEDYIQQVEEGFRSVDHSNSTTHQKIESLCKCLQNQKAREFLLYGAGRRLVVLYRSLNNIFSIYPPRRTAPLSAEELLDLTINLQAFFINLSGIYDNLAWTLVFEKNLSQQHNKFKVTLYKRPPKKSKDSKAIKCMDNSGTHEKSGFDGIQNRNEEESADEMYSANDAILTKEFAEYLNGNEINNWINRHLRYYRDHLAHRLPVYNPPGTNERGEPAIVPFYTASTNHTKGSWLHAQLIADFNTIVELIEKFIEFEFPKQTSQAR